MTKQIKKLQRAFQELAADNPEGNIKVETSKAAVLIVKVADIGHFEFFVDENEQTITLSSPGDAGTHSYKYDEQNDWWLSTKDTHNMEEMLSREFGAFAMGYLNL